MAGRWHPRQRSRFRLDPGLLPAAPSGPQLDRVERRGCNGELACAIEHYDRAVEPEMDLNRPTDVAGATDLGQGQDPPTERDRVIMGNLAPVLEHEHPLETDIGRQRSPGRHGVGGRDREPGVMASQVPREKRVRRGTVADLRQAQLDHEAILAGPPQPLDPALGLG